MPESTGSREVLAAYGRALDAMAEAALTSKASTPALAETFAEPMLDKLKNLFISRSLVGQAARKPEPSIESTTLLDLRFEDDGTATILECTVDDGIVFEIESGRIINDKVATLQRRAVLRLVGGTWKVTDLVNQGEAEGVTACAGSL